MKDVTSTSFGLLIAFLLPGFVGLYALSFWCSTLRRVFDTFLTVESNVGLSIMVLLAALALGLQVTVLRWVIFECWICKKDRLVPADFGALGDESKLSSFRAAVDEHYRYHQFWGGMVVVIPVLCLAIMWEYWRDLTKLDVSLCLAALVAVETITALAAREAFHKYVTRARHILKGAT